MNKEWVLKTKAFFDTLAVTHESGKKVKVFSQELAKENYAVYTLHNLLDLDNFWDEIILYLADHTKDKSYLSATNYAWWMILNLGRETKLFDNYHKKRIRSTVLLSKDNPLNQWAVRLYKEMRVSCKIKPQKNDPSIDLNVMGDTIIQVKYPPNIIKKIKKIFEEHTTVQDLDPKEITRLAHEPCEIKFIVFKNPSIAENLRKSYIESE